MGLVIGLSDNWASLPFSCHSTIAPVYLSAEGGSVGNSEPAVPTQSVTPKPRRREVTNLFIMITVIYTHVIFMVIMKMTVKVDLVW